MVVSELVARVRKIIGLSSESPVIDARMIVKLVTGLDDIHLIIDKNRAVSENECRKAFRLAELRAKHMPMAYITGSKEFMSLNFSVQPGILIPRPDTECIVDEAVKLVDSGKILDIGTGSGAIAVSLAYYIPKAEITAIDISELAVKTANENAAANSVDIRTVKADIFNYQTDDMFDLIISNPPYIESDEIAMLQDDVRFYEPLSALDGGADGLDFYAKITDFAVSHLRIGGYLIFEFGWKQHDLVCEIIKSAGLEFISTIYDLSGIKRGCSAKKI